MKECKHPTCGEKCRREKKGKKVYQLKRTPLKRAKYKIKPVAKKRAKENKIYTVQKAKFLIEREVCEIQSPECTYQATVIHHKKGREGTLFLDVTFWAASCERCNTYVEEKDAWAREHGHKLSKHKKDETTA